MKFFVRSRPKLNYGAYFLYFQLTARCETVLGHFGTRCVKPVRITDVTNSF